MVDLQMDEKSGKEGWWVKINETADGCQIFYTDGSKLEDGNVGGEWFAVDRQGRTEGCRGLGKVATVWDGEVAGVRGALEVARSEEKVVAMMDSQATILAITAAGKSGGARTEDLEWLIEQARASWRRGIHVRPGQGSCWDLR